MAHNGRALVVGGSMAGLFTALLLRQRNWDVCVFERSHVELTGRGAGIMTHPELRDATEALGLGPGTDLGIRIARRRMLDRAGDVIGEKVRPQVATSWNKLFEVLRHAFPADRYHRAKELQRVEQHGGQVAARFSDGSSAEGDVLVGADGFRSTVRAQFLPDVQPIYAGYVAWRGLVNESALSERTHRDLFPYFSLFLPPRELILGYPVTGPDNDARAGHRCYCFVWYRLADEAAELPELLTDANGRRHAISIPPPLIAPEVVREMRDHAEEVLAPKFREVVRSTDEPFLHPVYDFASPRTVFGRAALIGDAAFLARPHLGAGVAKAAQDAVMLVSALAGGDGFETALHRFEDAQRNVECRIVQRARDLGRHLQARLATPEERKLAENHRRPEAVLAETAVLDFLQA